MKTLSIRNEAISIHSLRMEGDSCVAEIVAAVRDFNPLPPHGGRPSGYTGC